MSDKSTDLPSPPPQLIHALRTSQDYDHSIDNAFNFGNVERDLSTISLFSSVTLMEEDMKNQKKKKDVCPLWETPKRSKTIPTLPPIINLGSQYSKNNISIGTTEEIYETPNSKYAKNLRSSTGFFEANGNIQWRSPSPTGSGRGTYSKYTSTLASLPTPTSAIRVSAQRRVPFSAHSYRLSSSSREKLCTDGFNKAFYEPVASSTPSPSITKGAGGNGAVDFYESILSYEVTHEYIENEEYHRCITYLSGKVFSETERCKEAQKIVLATKKQGGSRYTRNEVCAHALLLVSTCRLAMYKDLLSRINTYHRMSIGPPPVSKYVLSRVSIKEITINLLGAYILRTRKNDAQYAFMIVVSSHDRVMATEVMSVPENWALRKQQLKFNEDMNFLELPLNFQVRVEVFAMNLSDRQPTSTGKEIAKKALNLFGKCSSPLLPEEIEKQTSGFKPIGHMFITRDNAGVGGKKGFFLYDNEYPLDGTISITCECTPLPPELYVVHSGYWTFICGTGNTLFWVKMINGIIKFYDAHHKDDPHEEPTFVIDLSTICNKKVERELAQIKDEPRFAFYLDVLSFPRGCELCEHKRYLIGVENEEQLKYWLEWINTGLEVVRSNI